jgi:hypothetical protein
MDQRCGHCKELKDSNEFSPSYRGKNGTWCRACFAAYSRGTLGTVQHDERACVVCGAAYRPLALKANSTGCCSRECKEERRRKSGAERQKHLRRKYGITIADYDAMLAKQGGGCALCGVKPEDQAAKYNTYLHVDHCHATGRVRGLLCGPHNLLLGRFGDDPAQLRRAADYLDGLI